MHAIEFRCKPPEGETSRKRMFYRFTVTALACLGLVAEPVVATANDSDLQQRLKSEAPRAWSEMIKLSDHIDLELKRVVETTGGKNNKINSIWVFKSSGSNVVLTLTDVFTSADAAKEPRYQGLVYGRNSSYSFELAKSSNSAAWLVRKINTDLVQADESMRTSLRPREIPLHALKVFYEFLPDWFREPTFTITNVDWDKGHTNRVDLSFEYTWPDGRQHKSSYWPRRGTLFLRPDLLWAIEESEVEMVDIHDSSATPVPFSCKNELKLLSGGFPAVIRSTEVADSKTEGHVSMQWDFTRFEQREIPEDDFTLPAFGLPEIGNPTPRSFTRFWLALIAAGVICIAIGVFVRRRWRA
jgi:hypothetical protein